MCKKNVFYMKNLIILFFIIFSFGCSKVIEQNGVSPNKERLNDLKIGKITKPQVRNLIGDPIFVDSNNNKETWIYFSQKIEKFAFLKPELISRKVILLSFNNKILSKVETFSKENSKIINLNTKKVVSGGRKLTVLQQIFGNIGNFSAENYEQNL